MSIAAKVTATIIFAFLIWVASYGTWAFSSEARPQRQKVSGGMRVTWLRVQAAFGATEAQVGLANAYEEGRDVPADYKVAMEWWQRAAERGHAGAQSTLGERYHTGRGVPQNQDEAVRWFEPAAEAGMFLAQYRLADIYSTTRFGHLRPADAIKWWRRSAAHPSAGSFETTALQNVAWALSTGWGVPRNQQEALTIWRALAKHEDQEAMYHLGVAYATGDGVPADPAEAVRLWLKAVQQQRHMPDLRHALCVAYAKGEGVPRDVVAAADWCRRIAISQIDKAYETSEAQARTPSAASFYTVLGSATRHRQLEAMDVLRVLVPELRQLAARGDTRAQAVLKQLPAAALQSTKTDAG